MPNEHSKTEEIPPESVGSSDSMKNHRNDGEGGMVLGKTGLVLQRTAGVPVQAVLSL